MLLSEDGHVKRLQKRKKHRDSQGLCKEEIRTALLEARKAGLQAVKPSDLKTAKKSWCVSAAVTQVFSHREAWVCWVRLGSAFMSGHLKPVLCSKVNSLPMRTL